MWLCWKKRSHKIEKKIQHDSTIIKDAILIKLEELHGLCCYSNGVRWISQQWLYPPHWQRDQRAESISLPRKNRILTSVLPGRQFLTLLTSKCASRHNAVHCLNIATSKSGVFLTLLTLKCASHAHLNFEKCSEHEVFLCVVFGILTSKCASCHNGV